MLSRRDILQILALAGSAAVAAELEKTSLKLSKSLRVRTITAGIELDNASQLDRVERAIALLQRGRKHFEDAGYEVQTARIATNPFLAPLDSSTREKQLPMLEQLDRLAAKAGVIVRLNAGIYSILSTYGNANETARADVTVEAGKLTEATLNHAAAKVTFKLVTHADGDALADTQWNITTLRGEPVKESVGALPTHILAPGDYTAIARHSGQQFRRDFAVRAGDVVQVEVVMP